MMFSRTSIASGGTMVGNGGGFAEMQAIYLDQMLPLYLNFSNMYPAFYQSILKPDKPPFLFDFQTECSGLNPIGFLKNPLQIPSCLLYSSDNSSLEPQPKSLTKIGAIIFAFRWIAYDNNTKWDIAYQRGLKLFSNFQLKQKKIPMTWRSNLTAFLIIWDVIHPSQQSSGFQLSLELPHYSVDIKTKLEEQLKCASKTTHFNIKYMSLSQNSLDGFTAQGPVTWSCQGSPFAADMYLNVSGLNNKNISSKNELLQNQLIINLRILKKRPLSFLSKQIHM